MTLANVVAKAIEQAFAHDHLAAFSKLDARDGVSFRRYYRRTAASECEVSVYRDKWWTKAGGRVYVELFCLVDEVQKVLGDCAQSWLKPDYQKPLHVFQYRTSRDARAIEWEITTREQVDSFGESLQAYLLAEGLPWFDAFATRDGVLAYLEREERWLQLAELHAHAGDVPGARAAFARFLKLLPRGIEDDLQKMVLRGVVDAAHSAVLQRASLQQESDYERAVEAWCVAHRP